MDKEHLLNSLPDLPPAPEDSYKAACALEKWVKDSWHKLRDIASYGPDWDYPSAPRDAWHIVGYDHNVAELARKRGYGRFECPTHHTLGCTECACPNCGAGSCSCQERKLRSYDTMPPLYPSDDGVRGVRISTELTADSPETLQEVLAQYPWCHCIYEMSARDYLDDRYYESPSEFKPYCGFELRIAAPFTSVGCDLIADIFDRVSRIPGVCIVPHGSLVVAVERHYDHSLEILSRWLNIQDGTTHWFATRRHSRFSLPIKHDLTNLHNPHGALNIHDGTMYECRVHPATLSWVVAICWTAWVHQFICGGESKLGHAYLSARHAADWRFPREWLHAIEEWHAAHGSNYEDTLAAIARGEFKDKQQ